MAKKKTTNPTNLMAYDFLPNMGGNAGGGLYSQLAQLGRVQRSQPVMDQMATQAFFSPITTYINKAEEQAVAGMVEYNMANPDVDDSQLFDGTEEAIGAELQENSARFRELNRKLAYMSPNNKDYADTVTEINKINKANVDLRDQNKKLLDIRNLIKSSDISEFSFSNGAAYRDMYTDIQQGVKDNFSIKNGKITWTNPKAGNVKSIDVDTIPAEGPEFVNKAGYEFHTRNKLDTYKINAKGAMTPDALNVMAYKMREELGESGLKSLIWDNQNGIATTDENGNIIPSNALSKNGRFYNTEPFIQQYIASAGKSVSDPFIVDELKTRNTNYVLPGANKSIGEAFMDYYKTELAKETTFGKGYVPPRQENEETTKPIFDPNSYAYFPDAIVNGKTVQLSKKGTVLQRDRQKVIDIVLNNKGDRFKGVYGDYIWNAEKNNWTVGDEEISTYNLMTDEELFAPGQAFENSLFEQKKKESFTEQLAVSDFSDITDNANDVFDAINIAFKNKNAMTTGQDLKVERGINNKIILTGPDGSEKTFRFNNSGGFMLGSRNKKTIQKGQLVLEDLIKTVNDFLGFDELSPNN